MKMNMFMFMYRLYYSNCCGYVYMERKRRNIRQRVTQGCNCPQQDKSLVLCGLIQHIVVKIQK